MRKLLTVAAVVCAALLSSAPVGADELEDQAIADEVVAGTGDLVPDGWEEVGTGGGSIEGLPGCDDLTAAVDKAEEGPFAEIVYVDQSNEISTTSAGATVYIFGKAKQAKRFAKTLVSDDALDCAEAAASLFASGDVEAEELELGNAAGQRLTVEGQRDVFVLDSLRVRVGRGVVTVNTSSPEEPLPFVEDLIASVEESLKDAL